MHEEAGDYDSDSWLCSLTVDRIGRTKNLVITIVIVGCVV